MVVLYSILSIMIAFIKGELALLNPTNVYIETGGVGYDINISLNTYAKIEKLKSVQLWTHLHVKEDSHSLYGFYEQEEKRVFQLLITVSGIGPNTARVVLSSLTPNEAKSAILHENVQAFNKVKGIGPKTAKRIILDLKDKVAKEETEPLLAITADSDTRQQAISALIALGFQKNQAEKSIKQYFKPEYSVEDLIKIVLKQASK